MTTIDEQTLRARLAALDAAQEMTGFGLDEEEIERVLPLAEKLEAWLLRSPPLVDLSGVDQRPGTTMFDPATGKITTADPSTCGFSFGICGDERTADGAVLVARHICCGALNHDGLHACSRCGAIS